MDCVTGPLRTSLNRSREAWPLVDKFAEPVAWVIQLPVGTPNPVLAFSRMVSGRGRDGESASASLSCPRNERRERRRRCLGKLPIDQSDTDFKAVGHDGPIAVAQKLIPYVMRRILEHRLGCYRSAGRAATALYAHAQSLGDEDLRRSPPCLSRCGQGADSQGFSNCIEAAAEQVTSGPSPACSIMPRIFGFRPSAPRRQLLNSRRRSSSVGCLTRQNHNR
jgi:hypothetical protein